MYETITEHVRFPGGGGDQKAISFNDKDLAGFADFQALQKVTNQN